ncbi:hypothetical protein B0187_08120 [Haemophilus paracuniculus]|uniref:Sulfatase N-terminal domain-containing protein n=1 Tax=Haemophilus paracuniculus TaxID=734 RepID=A0A1T0AQS7_9PAST|nr:phosphoethanolamine transferase [Haemophilus paracuniculus]OOR98616.1 hypothetical protein B0187_08120 [Haemophilus paracuniculus]
MKKSLTFIFAFVLALIASHLMLLGTGFGKPNYFDTLLFAVMIIVLSQFRLTFWGILLPISIIHAFYAPVGLTFGQPTYAYIASIFATDLLESREFLTQLPLKNYVAAIAILLAVGFCRKFGKGIAPKSSLLPLFVLACGVFYFAFSATGELPRTLYSEGMKVKKELAVLNNLTIESKWGKSTLSAQARYDDYVLVIGESARKDYHHAYGYPIENTPFMSSANGVLIDGLKAGGTNTIASLKLMLTKPNTEKWEGNYEMALVDLIKSAGIKTIWLSNQGYLGEFDTPISSLANKSDEKIFTKAGDSLNQNISDFALLPKFAQVLKQPTNGKRFIVVHLYGSHPITCDRVSDYPKIFDESQIDKKYYNLNCYISSIKKTDEMLAKLYAELRQNKRSFSMIYVGDHGLSHQISEDNIVLQNSGKSKLHYDIPLFKTSSDDTERKNYKVFKSGLNFTDGIANWIGIQNPHLNPTADLFSNQSDPDDYGLNRFIDKIDTPLDPAVVVPNKR